MSLAGGPKGFYYRGAGLANVVVGFERDEELFVWRFCLLEKNDQSVHSLQKRNEANLHYIDKYICPLFSNDLVELPTLVKVPQDVVKQLFNADARIRDKLNGLTQLPFAPAFEMKDLTRQRLLKRPHDVFTIELKPKQGHMTGLERISHFCTNCLLQAQKCSLGKFAQMYDFCPLQLFSGNVHKMQAAVGELLHNPHNNLLITKNGQTVFDKSVNGSEEHMIRDLGFRSIESFAALVVDILRFSDKEADRTTTDKATLPPDCILDQLLRAERLDRVGPLKCAEMVEKLALTDKIDPTDCYQLFSDSGTTYTDEEDLAFLKNCLIAATVKDCSLMISLAKLVHIGDETMLVDKTVRVVESEEGKFAFKIKLVDLDAKKPAKMVKYWQRLKEMLDTMDTEDTRSVLLQRPRCW